EQEFVLGFDGYKYVPAISPFLFQKGEWGEQWDFFQEIRKQVNEYMIRADEFYFWGYGLPLADHHMFSWLYKILKDTRADCTIVDKLSDSNSGAHEYSNLIKMAKVVFAEKL